MNNQNHYSYIPISRKNQEKMNRYQDEVVGLEKIPIYCPRCKTKVDMVYVDATGHKDIKCWKCKLLFVTSLPRFRTMKKDWRTRW